jgi:hypothetical protein
MSATEHLLHLLRPQSKTIERKGLKRPEHDSIRQNRTHASDFTAAISFRTRHKKLPYNCSPWYHRLIFQVELMRMQAQQTQASSPNSDTPTMAPTGAVVPGVERPPLAPTVLTEVEFDTWSASSARLNAIAEVSRTIAGEIPAYETYVELKNSAVSLAAIEIYPCSSLTHTPRDFNYSMKVQEAERALSVAA